MNNTELEKLIYNALHFKTDYYGIKFDNKGWTLIDAVIHRINFVHGKELVTKKEFFNVVKNNPKFTLNWNKHKVFANEGGETFENVKAIPPDRLFYISSAKLNKYGLQPIPPSKNVTLLASVEQHVPSENIWVIDSRKMFAAGYKFYMTSENKWTTESVSPIFISSFI